MFNKVNLLYISVVILILFLIITGIPKYVLDESIILPDAYSYIDSSNLLFNSFKPHPIRPIVYAFIAGVPNLFIDSVSDIQYIIYNTLLNFIAWIITILLLNKALLLFVEKRISFWATVLFIINLGNLSHIFQVLSESVTTMLLTAILFYTVKYIIEKKISYLVYITSIMNVLALIRPGFLYLSIFFSIALIILIIKNKYFFNKKIIIFNASILMIAFQLVWMNSNYGSYTVSYIDKTTWYLYLGAEAKAGDLGIDFREERKNRDSTFEGLSWNEKKNISITDFKDQLSNNIGNIVKEYSFNLLENSVGGNAEIRLLRDKTQSLTLRILHVISRIQNIFYIITFVISGAYLLLYFKRFNPMMLVLTMIPAYIILTSGISFWQGDRFNVVLIPIFIFLLATVISKAFNRNKQP